MAEREASRIQGLGELIKQASAKGAAPVEQWDPPYCGDIGLEIDARGRWFYQGSVISRLELVKLFARVLRCDTSGRHYLVTPVEKVDVAVADAPFLAVEMQVDGEGSGRTITFRTNVDDVVVAGDKHPVLFREQKESGGLKPYVRVRGRLYARLTRPLYFDLVALADSDRRDDVTADTLAVESDGATFALAASRRDAFFNFDMG